MKKYALSIAFALGAILPLSAHDCQVKNLADRKAQEIIFVLGQYDDQGIDYELNFDYHMGYLLGQLKAYQEIQRVAEKPCH